MVYGLGRNNAKTVWLKKKGFLFVGNKKSTTFASHLEKCSDRRAVVPVVFRKLK